MQSAHQSVVITGANSGIGFEAALHFAGTRAQVVLACRNLDKAERAARSIRAQAANANLQVMQLDVSDLASVHRFVGQFAAEVGVLDLLINNAGIVAIPLTRNSAGHELQLATNYLGPFALTGLLLPLLRADAPTRIVNVGSLAHRFGRIPVEDLNWNEAKYDQWKAYANSKAAMLCHTLELNRRLSASGARTIALAAHPGFANTNIHQNSPALTRTHPVSKWLHEQMARFIPTAASAVCPVLLAAEGEVAGGDYYGPGGLLEIGGKPAPARVNPVVRDRELAERLWSESERLTGVSFLSQGGSAA